MRILVFASFVFVSVGLQHCAGQEPLPERPATAPAGGAAPAASPDEDYKQKISYVLGMKFGSDLKQNEVVLDMASLVAGITDALQGAQPRYTNEQLAPSMQRFDQEMRQKAAARMQAAAAKNKREGDAFLAENRTKPGVQVTPSGLQYRVIQKGDGAMPTKNDVVKCHYRGTFVDGTEFDSSYQAGEPIEFEVTGVIQGWTEALQLMHVGDKWQLFIPSKLAYGEQGNPRIGPNETLIFEIELLDVTSGAPRQ